jgi:sulfatase modifying factor 1
MPEHAKADVATRPSAPRPGMLWIEGGVFRMGSDEHYPEEAPARRVQVDGFWIDSHPVTNRQFAAFVQATGWKTVSERPVDPAIYPGVDPELLRPSSIVFVQPTRGRPLQEGEWWRYIPGADWRHPAGPNSSIEGLDDHPVTHVAWEDVAAYALWAGADLPTEAEWEYASRGGVDGAAYAWGEELTPDGKHMANVWQGPFPLFNYAEDGWPRTSPVGTYPANGYGLYDMIGNTWEWTRDFWSATNPKAATSACCVPKNPQGGSSGDSYDPAAPQLKIPRRVLKGGSHLCAPNYCRRYRPAARHAQAEDSGASHVGFRCVVRP